LIMAKIFFADGIEIGIGELPIVLTERKKPLFRSLTHTMTGYVEIHYYDKLFFGHILGTLTKKQRLKYRLLKVIKK
jgi:hypothetical protein